VKIAFCVGSRANWGSCKSVIEQCRNYDNLEPTIIAFGSVLSDRYTGTGWDPVEEMKTIARTFELPSHIEPTTARGATVAAASALGAFDFSPYDLVYVVGDRYEVLAAAYAATIQRVPIAHQMGGEVSGNIDEHIRHAITKLAHLHFVANSQAMARVVSMGEMLSDVHVTGCPRMDLIARSDPWQPGPQPHVLVLLHPEPDYPSALEQAVHCIREQSSRELVWLWPNADPGSNRMVEMVRGAMGDLKQLGFHVETYRGLPPERFYRLLKGASMFVGNSSAAVRDSVFAGVPSYVVGERQLGRKFDPEDRFGYGDGFAGSRIAKILATRVLPQVQKRMP
jgi:UDP-hydrolysing UDP-N-acetyl-D-glucosamine 2-epimerase